MFEVEEFRSGSFDNKEGCAIWVYKLKRIKNELLRICDKEFVSGDMLYAFGLWISDTKGA